MEKYQEVLDILDDEIHFLIELEASICYLREVAYSQQSDLDNAKQWFKKALEIDVKCFEAFNGLVINHMMANKEEWDFVNSLKFDELLEYEEAYFIKMNYISMLKKHEHVIEVQEARSELENKFRLSNNAAILLSHTDELYTQCRFKECLEVTTKIWTYFAIESEHDQAIAAYSTAAKLYPSLHLPTLFIGMQHLQAKNLLSAEEYLLTSSQICESDPLVLNELGVLYFQKLNELDIAESYFQKVVSMLPPSVVA
ncbi:hypothetical protein C2G38_2192141 [Gigaspora rosea]|uniref:Uncharacterized protein n=1 Tax=Gigaspora rosea TaxID=44941 RepID=A0A397UZ94_9GLOM|nr:hypothetical protein C2G38_2192141 [Gigaspora rosea]